MRKLVFVLVVFALLVAIVPSVGATGPAQVYVVHGIPGKDLGVNPALPVDIKVGNLCALTNFTFGQIAGPVPLPPGTYRIQISLSDGKCGKPPVIAENVLFGRSENAAVVAHLRVNGQPTLTKFTNFVQNPGSNKSRLLIRHTANAPVVDITAQRPWASQPALKVVGVANAQVKYGEVNVTVPSGKWDVRLFPTGSSTVVFGPVQLNLSAQKIYMIFAVGSLKNGTFTLLSKEIPPAY
jgi:hypothetical protein